MSSNLNSGIYKSFSVLFKDKLKKSLTQRVGCKRPPIWALKRQSGRGHLFFVVAFVCGDGKCLKLSAVQN